MIESHSPTRDISSDPSSADTRNAILRAALLSFSQTDYDGADLWSISQAAGVTEDVVKSYFTTKAELFAEIVEIAFSTSILGDGIATLDDDPAKAVVALALSDAEPIDPVMLILRSAQNADATAILRDGVERHFERPLAASLKGEEPDQRAALLLALIAGIRLVRTALSDTDSPGIGTESLSNQVDSLINSSDASENRKYFLVNIRNPKNDSGLRLM
jgi:AcrR family transcriptional regulator